MTSYLSLNGLARHCAAPVSKITPLIQSGAISAIGRAGGGANAPLLFTADQVGPIRRLLNAKSAAPAKPAPRSSVRRVTYTEVAGAVARLRASKAAADGAAPADPLAPIKTLVDAAIAAGPGIRAIAKGSDDAARESAQAAITELGSWCGAVIGLLAVHGGGESAAALAYRAMPPGAAREKFFEAHRHELHNALRNHATR